MSKQKFTIAYQRDDTIQTISGLNSMPDPPIPQTSTQFRLHLQSAQFSKRNKLVSKRGKLKNLIFKHKVDKIQKTFIKKMRLNSIYRSPCDESKNQLQSLNQNDSILMKTKKIAQKIGKKQGLSIGNIATILWSFINIIQITLMVFVFSIMMAFSQTRDYPMFLYFRTFSIVLYVIDMFLNFTVKRYERGKYLKKIAEISAFYLKNGFIIDLNSILIFPIDVLVSTNITIFISFVAIIKLSNNMKKFQKFQYHVINSSQKQHYYGLVKVFLTNFAIGHFLSIFLNLMAGMNSSQNWQIKMGITNSIWYIKYAWGYYWGTNIMLTVGFGDIAATNYYEAIVLVFIETVSCITLAYNINYVGALIGSIRASEEQKKKKLKILHRMCKQNFVSQDMQSKVSNFIEQSHHIRESFEYDAYDEVLKSLPKGLERQYRKQANATIFDSLGFLNNLSKKSLLKLAEEVNRKICHPQQIILKKGSISDFLILQKGCISLTCRIRSVIDGKQIQVLDVGEGSKPKILSLDFIKNKILNYNVKSNRYSVLYYLSRQDFMQSLRISQMDFQLFCMMKDKDDYTLEESHSYECPNCKGQYHNKFDCNRFHFIPLKQNIVMKFLSKVNMAKQKRQQCFRRRKVSLRSLINHRQLKQSQVEYIKAYFDQMDYDKIKRLYQFYKQTKGQIQQTRSQAFQMFKNSSKSHPRMPVDDKTLFKLQQFFQAFSNKPKDIWDFQLDRAEDFNFYFNQGNPQNLKSKKKGKRRKQIDNLV